MSVVEFLREGLSRLHRQFNNAISDLNVEQMHWRPGEGCNHIAFTVWHYTRTEDNVIRFVLHRQPTVWMEGGWDKRFGLDSKAQGTGMPGRDAADLRISSPQDFLRYMGEVWQTTDRYLATMSDKDLERVTLIRPQGERSVGTILAENMLTHGFSHLGETWVLRGLQGIRGTSA